MSTLYMVATPIGNLEDITLRALETLKQVAVIACEDTRHTQRLLHHYDIHKRLIACHAHNEQTSAAGIVKLLEEGNSVAFVSDAGTPGISDPGARVVATVRAAGFTIVPIPGPSAVSTLLSVSAFTGKTFTFEGFLSPKSGRRRGRLEQLLGREEAFILYESPYRVVKLLEELAQLDGSRRILVGRELTKAFEELVEGSAAQVAQQFASRQSIKGEFAILVSPPAIGETT
jgi:16S rRNA (cytidine1402-2'-O)-methyltransferase